MAALYKKEAVYDALDNFSLFESLLLRTFPEYVILKKVEIP